MEPDDYILVNTSEEYACAKNTNKYVWYGMCKEYTYKSESTDLFRTQAVMIKPFKVRLRDRSKYNPKDCFKKGNK